MTPWWWEEGPQGLETNSAEGPQKACAYIFSRHFPPLKQFHYKKKKLLVSV